VRGRSGRRMKGRSGRKRSVVVGVALMRWIRLAVVGLIRGKGGTGRVGSGSVRRVVETERFETR